jgi:c-di-GMP-binding flagellar brake protein YcgR
MTSPERPLQRRDSVRAGYVTEVLVGRSWARMIRSRSIDISGSGLRAILPGLELHRDEEVDVFLRLANGFTVEARALVVRSAEEGVTAFRFVEIDSNLRELLIRQVFVEQRRAIASAKGRE